MQGRCLEDTRIVGRGGRFSSAPPEVLGRAGSSLGESSKKPRRNNEGLASVDEDVADDGGTGVTTPALPDGVPVGSARVEVLRQGKGILEGKDRNRGDVSALVRVQDNRHVIAIMEESQGKTPIVPSSEEQDG